LTHNIEEGLTPYREATQPIPREQVTRLLELVDACGERLKPVFSPAADPRPSAPPREAEDGFTSVRVEFAEMDALLYALADTTTHIGSLHRETGTLDSIAETANTLVTELSSLSGPSENGKALVVAQLRSLADELRTALRQSFRSLHAGL